MDRTYEERIVIEGTVPPQAHDTLVFRNLYDFCEDKKKVILVETAEALGKTATRIEGTYLENDVLCYVEALAQNSRPNAKRTFGHAQYYEPSQ